MFCLELLRLRGIGQSGIGLIGHSLLPPGDIVTLAVSVVERVGASGRRTVDVTMGARHRRHHHPESAPSRRGHPLDGFRVKAIL